MLKKLQLRLLDERMRDHIPRHATTGSAGLDLCACIERSMTLAPGAVEMIPTGLSVFVEDPGWAALILPRSGLGHRHGIVLGNLVGLIDSDYQGPLMISCWNRSTEPFVIEPMMRIAQLVVVPVAQVEFDVVDEFAASTRGAGGFGSTGR